MATYSITRKHVLVQRKQLTIFGFTGYEERGLWYIKEPEGEDFLAQDPDPIFQDILKILETDIKNGEDKNIFAIVLSPEAAVKLWCEGILKRDDFIDITVITDEEIEEGIEIKVKFPKSQIKRRIIITPSAQDLAYTVDEEYKIIPG